MDNLFLFDAASTLTVADLGLSCSVMEDVADFLRCRPPRPQMSVAAP